MSANVTVPPSDGGSPAGLPGNRVNRGTIGRWTEATGWADRDGLPMPSPMLVIGYTTIIRRWENNRPIDIVDHPLPDVNDLNKNIPMSTWETGRDGKPRPPHALTYVIYMVDLKTGALYTYANSTYGAMLCYTNLEESVAVYRMLRGEHVWPIVTLEKRPMKTGYGMSTRPHLQPTGDWRAPGFRSVSPSPTPQISGPSSAPAPTSTATTPAIPSSTPSTPTAPSSVAAASAPSSSPVLDATKPVKPVTVGEVIADELPPWA